MITSQASQQYLENTIRTASPEELTLMLYNGLVKFLLQAQKAMEEKDIEKTHNSIVRAQAIIEEFQRTLVTSYEVAGGLAVMYDFMQQQLLQANLRKDVAILEPVIGFAKELRDTWAEAIKQAKAGRHETQRVAK